MKKTIFALALVTNYGFAEYAETIEIKKKSIPLSSTLFEQNAAQSENSFTMQQRLASDISFATTANGYHESDISFRGVSGRATGFTEDLIPLYRSTGGTTHISTIFADGAMVANMASAPSSLGVSSIGGDIDVISQKPQKEMEGKALASFAQNNRLYDLYVGGKYQNYYIQLNGVKETREKYKLSNEFTPTTEQPSKDRLNSDSKREFVSLKIGAQINSALDAAVKVETSRGVHGIEPNIFDNGGGFGYQRINKKDLDSYYFYLNYAAGNIEANLRVYYDAYKDIYDFYTSAAYGALFFPSSLYDDKRLGALGKFSYKASKEQTLSYVVNIEDNEHIWVRDGSPYKPRFRYESVKNSLIDETLLTSKLRLDGAVTHTTFRPVKIDFDGDSSFGQNNATVSNSSLDWQAKATYSFDSSAVYASVAKTSRAPAMKELFAFFPWDIPNSALKSEKAMQFETGYKYFFKKDSALSVAVFAYDIKDKIVQSANKYQNISSAKHDGIELRYNNKSFDIHEFNINYALTQTKDQDGKALALIPRQKLIIDDKVSMSKNSFAKLAYSWTDKRLDNYNGSDHTVGSFGVLDGFVCYETLSKLTMTLGMKNILDKNYYTEYGHPAEGRNIYVSISQKF
jgi:iron complex outermembrane recepter protein